MKKFFNSFLFAVKGIRSAFKEHNNLKVQTMIALVTIILGFYFRLTQTEWCVILLAIGFVLSLEMMNTAIEGLVDLVTRERNPLAGKIKDIAAGAVLITSAIAFIVGLIVFSKYLFSLT